MAETAAPSMASQLGHVPNFEPKIMNSSSSTTDNCISNSILKNGDDEIPTIDYSLLISDDPCIHSKGLANLAKACQDYGFFYLVNGVSNTVVKGALEGVSDFFYLREDEKMEYSKKNSTEMMRWAFRSTHGENREYLKVAAHPQFHCPINPPNFSDALKEYLKSMREVELVLAKAISKNLGFEECFIEKAFNLECGFDVCAMNFYPPHFKTKGRFGLAEHTDPGFFVSLAQDINGGLELLDRNGNWYSVTKMPQCAILINLGDDFEIFTNGKYKSCIHRVILENNEVNRISMVTLHGPSIDNLVTPAPQFVDHSRPLAYRGVTYKETLEFNGDVIDVQSGIKQIQRQLQNN